MRLAPRKWPASGQYVFRHEIAKQKWLVQLALHQPSKVVGAAGFEPATFWSRTKRATSLRYTPKSTDLISPAIY